MQKSNTIFNKVWIQWKILRTLLKKYLYWQLMLVQGKLIIYRKIKNRDPNWIDRLKEEYLALIKYVEINKGQDNDWFKIESNKEGTK